MGSLSSEESRMRSVLICLRDFSRKARPTVRKSPWQEKIDAVSHNLLVFSASLFPIGIFVGLLGTWTGAQVILLFAQAASLVSVACVMPATLLSIWYVVRREVDGLIERDRLKMVYAKKLVEECPVSLGDLARVRLMLASWKEGNMAWFGFSTFFSATLMTVSVASMSVAPPVCTDNGGDFFAAISTWTGTASCWPYLFAIAFAVGATVGAFGFYTTLSRSIRMTSLLDYVEWMISTGNASGQETSKE